MIMQPYDWQMSDLRHDNLLPDRETAGVTG